MLTKQQRDEWVGSILRAIHCIDKTTDYVGYQDDDIALLQHLADYLANQPVQEGDGG